jgi:hypothetical protein
MYRAGSRWKVGYDKSDWHSGRMCYYPTGNKHTVEEKGDENNF